MDYVQKAIEKARRERGAGQPEAGHKSPPGNVDSKPDGVTVEYTQTRCAEAERNRLMDHRVIAAFDHDERAEPYRQLRTQILKKFRDNGWRTLAITSAREGAGKTLTALNLAIALAREVSQTVLLVDMDLKKPSLLRLMGIDAEQGLVEHLRDGVPLDQILVNPGFERLVVLPSVGVAGPTSEILSSPRTRALLKELIDRYPDRLIIFDLPPLLRDDDAMVIAPLADASLLVVEEGVTSADDLERCAYIMEGANVLGTILNKARQA